MSNVLNLNFIVMSTRFLKYAKKTSILKVLLNAIFTVFVFNMLHCDEKFNMPGYVHFLYFL